MLKNLARFALISSISMLTSGCLVFGFSSVKTIPIGGPPLNRSAQVQAPVIHLEYSGSAVAGVEGNFNWHTANATSGGSGWSGAWPPSFPGTLTAQVGRSVEMVVNYGQPAAALWVAELNAQGIPSSSLALTPTSNITAYPVSHAGRYTLMVTAQWSYQDNVTYYFALEVQP